MRRRLTLAHERVRTLALWGIVAVMSVIATHYGQQAAFAARAFAMQESIDAKLEAAYKMLEELRLRLSQHGELHHGK